MNKYILPVYLNQRYVFDLLAMLEDGFSQVETVKTGQTNSTSDKASLKGELGVNDIFSFLKLSSSGEKVSGNGNQQNEEHFKEKIHTPNSLFFKMRNILIEKNLIKVEKLFSCKAGDFAELKVILRKNPIIDVCETLPMLMQLANSSTKGGNKNDSNLKMFADLLEKLKKEGGLDLIGECLINEESFQIVLTLEQDFIRDLSLSEILDGEFSVLGKIIKVIPKTDTNIDSRGINLLRKTSLSKLNKDVLEQFYKGFQTNEFKSAWGEEIQLEISPPVLQVLPIAIYT